MIAMEGGHAFYRAAADVSDDGQPQHTGGFYAADVIYGQPGRRGARVVQAAVCGRMYREGERAEDYAFIPANVYDNEVLMQKDPGYVKTLEALPEDRRRAYLYGDWDVFAGQYFPEFDRRLHVTEPFVVPKAWRRYVTLDYGLDMLAAYWIAVDLQGFAYVYRELYEKDLIISEAAERLLAMTGRKNFAGF